MSQTVQSGALKPVPSAKRRWLKRIGVAMMSLVALLLIAAMGIVLLLQSGAGRNFIEARIEGLDVAGQTVEIDGLSGSVLGTFGIERITLTGRDSPWLIAQDITVDWSPRRVLSKTLKVDRLQESTLLHYTCVARY
jgi:translocation and assembly module TamB